MRLNNALALAILVALFGAAGCAPSESQPSKDSPTPEASPTVNPPTDTIGNNNVPTSQVRQYIGETANYQLNRAPVRTSMLITSGSASANVVNKTALNSTSAYNVQVAYNMNDTYKGTITIPVSATFFDPTFLTNLAQTGYTEMDGMTFQYRGACQARQLSTGMIREGQAVTISGLPDVDNISNTVLTACVDPTLPVLGAMTLDFAFTVTKMYIPMNLRAGFDLNY